MMNGQIRYNLSTMAPCSLLVSFGSVFLLIFAAAGAQEHPLPDVNCGQDVCEDVDLGNSTT